MPVMVHGIIHQSLFRTVLKNPSVKKDYKSTMTTLTCVQFMVL